MKGKFTISLVSEDRPGIVANVSAAVFELEGNILGLSQTVVEGYFTIILVGEFPGTVTSEGIRKTIEKSGGTGEYSVIVRDYKKPRLPAYLEKDATEYVLTATGPDNKGIIHHISRTLSGRGINILDIAVYKEKDQVMIVAQVLVPHSVDLFCLKDELAALGMSQKLSVHLQHINIFKETNRI